MVAFGLSFIARYVFAMLLPLLLAFGKAPDEPSRGSFPQQSCTRGYCEDPSTVRDLESWENPALSPDEEKAIALAQSRLKEELLWFARAVYSESKRRNEQWLVAWVIRNRVDSGYQGRRSYRDVVLAPYQFSVFNSGNPKRAFFLSLEPDSRAPGWRQAYEVARKVLLAPARERPFSITTRHFYSERSMSVARLPHWVRDRTPVRIARANVEDSRFRFFDDVM